MDKQQAITREFMVKNNIPLDRQFDAAHCGDLISTLSWVSMRLEDRAKLYNNNHLFRLKQILEEVVEYACALNDGNEVAAFDAVTDLQIYAAGIGCTYDWPLQAGLDEVNRSNATKTSVTNDEQGRKLSKGPNYSPPNLAGVLLEWRSFSQRRGI